MTTGTPILSDPVAIALIGMLGTFLTALLSLVTAYLGRQNSKSITAQKGTIEALEKNTNSIKDALVKATGESEFARGLKIGGDAAGGSPAGVAALTAEVQKKAAHEQGVVEGTATEKNRAKAEKAEKVEGSKT
jgi:hypothetical protein